VSLNHFNIQLSSDNLCSSVMSASSVAAAQSSTDTLPIGGGFATLTSGSMSQSQSTSSSSSDSSVSASQTGSSSAFVDGSTQLRATNGSPTVLGSPLVVSVLGALLWTFGL